MPSYAVPCSFSTLTSSLTTVGIVTAAASALKRGFVYEFIIGASSVPNATDCPIIIDISRQTAAGTTTSVTPRALDPADGASVSLAGSNATVEGTVTASSSVFSDAMNQRNSIRWVARDDKSRLVFPNTNSNGFALRASSPNYTGNIAATIYFDE